MDPAYLDLENRRPVWEEMSKLFLDTEFDSVNLDKMTTILSESKYSYSELDQIFRREVAPVLGFNLLSVAGIWTSFDQEWLETEILRREKRRLRWYRIFNFSRLVNKEWESILKQVNLKRAE